MDFASGHETELLPLLRKLPTLQRLDEFQLIELAACFQRRVVPAGTVVFRQGDRGDAMVLLADGMLRIDVHDGNKAWTSVASVKPGEFVGEMALLDPAPRSATVLAPADCVLYEMTARDLEYLEKRCPPAASRLVAGLTQILTKRVRQVHKQLDKVVLELIGEQEGTAATKPEPAGGSVLGRMWARLTGF